MFSTKGGPVIRLLVQACALSLALLCSGSLLSAQVSEAAAQNLVRRHVLEFMKRKPDAFLEITREEELEKTFARFIHDEREEPPFIFHVTDVGDEVRGNTVIHHVPTPSLWLYVAVSGSGRVFLFRAKDCLEQINLLADARGYAAWCITMTFGYFELSRVAL